MILRSRKIPALSLKDLHTPRKKSENNSPKTPRSAARVPKRVQPKSPCTPAGTFGKKTTTRQTSICLNSPDEEDLQTPMRERSVRVHFQFDDPFPGKQDLVSSIYTPVLTYLSTQEEDSDDCSAPTKNHLYFSHIPVDKTREDFNPYKFICNIQQTPYDQRQRQKDIPFKTRSAPESTLVLDLKVLHDMFRLQQPSDEDEENYFALQPFWDLLVILHTGTECVVVEKRYTHCWDFRYLVDLYCYTASWSDITPPNSLTEQWKEDEILVDSSLLPLSGADFTFLIPFQDNYYKVYVKLRPHAIEFLETLCKVYEIFVFTTAKKEYAEKIIDLLDPQKKLIRHRLFQDQCVCVEGHYVKDLGILQRDLAKTVALDTAPHIIPYNLSNRIPIQSWKGSKKDRGLLSLIPTLEEMSLVDDVRLVISHQFKIKELVAED